MRSRRLYDRPRVTMLHFQGKSDLRASASNAADKKSQQKWLNSEAFYPMAFGLLEHS
jgi:hypothetical protein